MIFPEMIGILKIVSALVASLILGNWFLAEVHKSRAGGAPWYRPYLSTPGLLILAALMIPVVLWVIGAG